MVLQLQPVLDHTCAKLGFSERKLRRRLGIEIGNEQVEHFETSRVDPLLDRLHLYRHTKCSFGCLFLGFHHPNPRRSFN